MTPQDKWLWHSADEKPHTLRAMLDFNYDELTKLVNTNAGDKQEKLI